MRIGFLILLLGISSCLFSQVLDQGLHIFKGIVQETKSQKAIEYGAIKNISTGEVILTNRLGVFEIEGSIGDTLRFHSMGYVDTTWVVPTIWTAMKEDLVLDVPANIYSITEVEVLRFYSYAHFRQAFKDLELPKDQNEEIKAMVSSWNFKEAIALGKAERKFDQGTFGLSIGTGSGKTCEDRKKEEVKRLEKVSLESDRFNYLTSRKNLADLTGYKGTCLDSFMVFLNSNYSINYKMNDYNLLTSIMGAYEDFKELKNDKDWYDFPNDSTNIQ